MTDDKYINRRDKVHITLIKIKILIKYLYTL